MTNEAEELKSTIQTVLREVSNEMTSFLSDVAREGVNLDSMKLFIKVLKEKNLMDALSECFTNIDGWEYDKGEIEQVKEGYSGVSEEEAKNILVVGGLITVYICH